MESYFLLFQQSSFHIFLYILQKDINLIAFECKKVNGEISLLEHEDYKWISKNELENFQFAPADLFIIEKIKM